MSSLPWPSFWQHMPEPDRGAVRDILTELLGTGVLLGQEGRGRTLYLLAREYRAELAEYLAPLQLELIEDLEHSILQARPVPGECGLTAKFTKAETLLVLTLWRIYDDARLQQFSEAVLTTVNGIFQQWRTFFEQIEPPSEAQMERILGKLRRLRLVRLQARTEVEALGDLQVEILPTLAQIIPFENAAAWEQQAAIYQGRDSASEPTGDENEEESA